jgi:hypothetical protein
VLTDGASHTRAITLSDRYNATHGQKAPKGCRCCSAAECRRLNGVAPLSQQDTQNRTAPGAIPQAQQNKGLDLRARPMLKMDALLLLATAGLGTWFWLDSLRAREIATAVCRHVCERQHLQFLDGTVSLKALGLARNSRGRLQIRRVYRFDFSEDGLSRCQGRAVTVGSEVMDLLLPQCRGGDGSI